MIKTTGVTMAEIDNLLKLMFDRGASDLHCTVGQKPKFSLRGEVVELDDGRLYMNARSRMGKRRRAFCFSADGGQTWSPIRNDPGMPERSCQGSTLRLGPGLIGVAHPVDEQARRVLTVRASRDECRSWPVSRVVDNGAAAYSDMVVNRRGQVLVAYESRQYQAITVARFNLAWVLGGVRTGDKVLQSTIAGRKLSLGTSQQEH